MSSYRHLWKDHALQQVQKYVDSWNKDLNKGPLYDLALKYLKAYDGKVINANIKKVFPGFNTDSGWVKERVWTENEHRYAVWWMGENNRRSHLTIVELNKMGNRNGGLPEIEIALCAGERFNYDKERLRLIGQREEMEKQAKAGLAHIQSGDFQRDMEQHNKLIKAIEDLWEGKLLQYYQVSY